MRGQQYGAAAGYEIVDDRLRVLERRGPDLLDVVRR